MATFAQFRELLEQGEVKRAYYLYGPERMLVEEAVDLLRRKLSSKDFDAITLSASSTSDKEIWAQANQYPLTQDGRRMVLVRDAEAIKSWAPFFPWIDSRLIPNVTVIFVSSERDVDTSESTPHMFKFVKAGAARIVKCSKQSSADQIKYLTRRFGMSETDAKQLLERVGEDLAVAANVASQAKLLGRLDGQTLKALARRTPAEDFIASLMALKKDLAIEATRRIGSERVRGILLTLDTSLSEARTIRKAMRFTDSALEVYRSTGVQVHRVKELERVAPNYDDARTRRCVRALALVDAAVNSGETAGVLETLVALW